jgi:hypothetical protein
VVGAPKQDQKKQQTTTPQIFELQKDNKNGKKIIKKT